MASTKTSISKKYNKEVQREYSSNAQITLNRGIQKQNKKRQFNEKKFKETCIKLFGTDESETEDIPNTSANMRAEILASLNDNNKQMQQQEKPTSNTSLKKSTMTIRPGRTAVNENLMAVYGGNFNNIKERKKAAVDARTAMIAALYKKKDNAQAAQSRKEAGRIHY